ncbi:hypothetical protein [Providencia phage PSTRCR_127]|nr:hypothetical protein [Providencia phage PSTRCR_127]
MIKYTIFKDDFYEMLLSLGDDEGYYSGWGRFVKTNNQKLINFLNDYLLIEHENIPGQCYAVENMSDRCYAISAHWDESSDFWLYGQSQKYYVEKFNDVIKDAISNTGMYENFGNSF